MSHIHFWHGWGMHKSVWQPLEDRLKNVLPANTSYCAQALPGYDDAPLPASTADWVDTLLLNVQEPIVLCGWSMGAILALEAAVKYPRKIHSLILFGATPAFAQHEDWSCAVAPIVEKQFQRDLKRNLTGLLSRFPTLFCHRDENEKAIVRALAGLPAAPLETLMQGLNYLHETDLRAQIHQITCPVLLIHGTLDPLMPVDAIQWLHAHLPHAQLSLLQRVAHCPFLSQPVVCAETIEKFLKQNNG